MSPRGALLVMGLLALGAGPGAARAQEIAGTAVDSAGRPLASVPVALHRVGGGSGATVAAATTEADGRFRFTIEVEDSAVYFVAMRHADRMYIGPPVRGGAERVTDYLLRAHPGNEAGAVASALGGSGAAPGVRPPSAPAARGRGEEAAWFVVILALVVAAVFITTAPRYRQRRGREMVMELARLENRLAAAAPEDDTTPDRRRRDALRERLSPRG